MLRPLGTWIIVAVLALLPTCAAADHPPPAERFDVTALFATPGSLVVLHWQTAPGESFLLTNRGGSAPLPGFNSTAVVRWPANAGGAWHGAPENRWSSTANQVSVSISADATPGTAYALQLYTCRRSLCSNAPGGSGPSASQVAIAIAPNFSTSSLTAIAGTSVSLHWAPLAGTTAQSYPGITGQFYLLTNRGGSAGPLPNFGSSATVTWPASQGGTWHGAPDEWPASQGGTWHGAPDDWWVSTAGAVSLAIPASAAPGTTFALQLYTCNLRICSNSQGGSGPSQITIAVAGTSAAPGAWTTNPSPRFTTHANANGEPLDVAITGAGPTSTIWNDSEFSDALGATAGGQSAVTSIVDPADDASAPFGACWNYPKDPCTASAESALGERVIAADGFIWFTQGGWFGYPSGQAVPNQSAVVAYNPATGGFCTYLVPGNNPEVVGIAATGSGVSTTIWFVESAKAVLAAFQPNLRPDSCPKGNANTYALPSSSFPAIPLTGYPQMVTVDPNGQQLWVSDLLGSVEEVDISASTYGATTRYAVSPRNAYLGGFRVAAPWQVVADTGYVYAIDYAAGDDQLVRIDKATGHMDETPIPVTSDFESGYGLALYTDASTGTTFLYFTLADDAGLLERAQPSFGAASTFGVINLSAWERASALCSCLASLPDGAGVVYGGVSNVTDPASNADFRGITVGNDGQVALADWNQVVSLP